MPDKDKIQQALIDFDVTIKAKPNLSDKELLSKFPEFDNDINKLQAAKDYSATLNSGKYKDPSEFNSKFPEFFAEEVKKKELLQPSATQLPSVGGGFIKGLPELSEKELQKTSSIKGGEKENYYFKKVAVGIRPSAQGNVVERIYENPMGVEVLQVEPKKREAAPIQPVQKVETKDKPLKGVKPIAPTNSELNEQGWLLNMVSAIDKGVYKTLGTTVQAVGTGLQGVTSKITGGTGEGFVSDALIKLGTSYNQMIDDLTPQDESFKGSLSDQVGNALGYVAGLILTGGGSAAAKAAGTNIAGRNAATIAAQSTKSLPMAVKEAISSVAAPTGIVGGLGMGQAEFDRAKQSGATDEQAFEAFYKNAAMGSVLEQIPVMHFLKRFNSATSGGVINYIKTKGVAGLTGGIEEMTTEMLQQLYANKTAKDIYNTNQDLFEGVVGNGTIGFSVGFLLNAMGANAKILRKEGNIGEAKLVENQVKELQEKAKGVAPTNNAITTKIAVNGSEEGLQRTQAELDNDFQKGLITEEEHQEKSLVAQKASEVNAKIPDYVQGVSRSESIELINERENLQQELAQKEEQKKNIDVAYHKSIDESNKELQKRIDEINNKLGKIAAQPQEEVLVKKPTQEEILEDLGNGNTVTFEYKNENEVPEVFKDKISSKGEINGKPYVKVTMAKSLADFHLQEQPKSESLLSKELSPELPIEEGVEVVDAKRVEGEPETKEGVRVVTRSGMTENERVKVVEERRKKTTLTEKESLHNDLIDLANRADKARGNEKANLQGQIRQKVRELNAKAGEEIYRYDGVSVRIKSKSKKKGERFLKIKGTTRDISGRAIKDDAVLLFDRSPEFVQKYEELAESPNITSLQVDSGNGVTMTADQIESALQDIADGIPSVQADNLLNALEEGFNRGYFDLRGEAIGQKRIQAPIEDFIGVQQEEVGKPMDEDEAIEWLNQIAEIPQEEQIEIDNIILEYEQQPQQIDISGKVQQSKPESKEGSTPSPKPNKEGEGNGKPKTEVSRQPIEKAEPKGEDVDNPALKDVDSTAKVIEDGAKWYKAEKAIKDKDGNDVTLTIDKNKDDKHFYIKATDSKGNEIGSALFETTNGKVWSGNEIEVNEGNRRKGIMSAMYDFAESEGHPLEPTKSLSKEGKAFWNNRKSESLLSKEQTEPATQEEIEATAKALEGVQRENVDKFVSDFANIDIPFRQENIQAEMDSAVKKQLFPNEKTRRKYAETIYSAVVRSSNFPKILSEAYHKAKKDGSNPELVKAVEELLSQPKKPTKQAEAKPTKVEDKKEPKKISDKAREQAAKLRSGEANVLPDWLRANLPKGTKKQGADINDVYAKALEVFADTYDKLNDFKKAADEAFKGISDWFKQNNIDIDEADFKAKFEAQLKGEKVKDVNTPIEPPTNKDMGVEETPIEQKMRSFYKNVIERSKGLTTEQKELLKADPNALYNVLPVEESKRIAREVIEEIGVEAAVLEASKSNSGFQPVEKVMILGAAMDYYAAEAKKAKTQEGFNKAADNEIDAQEKMLQVAAELGTLGTAYGRAINIFKEVYKLSSFALERKLKETVKKVNELKAPQANEQAKEVKKIISNEEGDVQDAAKDLTETQLMREADAIRKVEELEKEVEKLKKEILQRDNAAKGTKKNPLKIKRVTNDSEYDKRVKEFKQRQRSIISKDDITDLTYFGLYHIENGITKFADWYNVMSKEFKGFKDKLGEIYANARGKAVENGADENVFDNDDAVQKYFDDAKAESDAKKMANASKKVAIAKFNKEMENNPDRARVLAPRMAAERVRRDAARNLDMPSTEKEQTYLKKLIQVVNQKAKDYYKEQKQNIKNINDILAFAIANGKSDYAIWERTQQEVEKQIDEDTTLTDEQKQEVKDFLSDYQESIFDTLMTEKQIDQLVREKLIEAGYAIEKTINGKVVKSIDWNKIIGSAKTITEAREKIAKAIISLGFTEQQAKGEIDAAIQAFDSKVAEKKEKAINAFLNKSIVNKAKSALGVKKKVPKNKISQMIEMNNKGMLDNEKIKDVLAEELGLIELTKEDIDKVKELAELIEDESIPRYMKRQFEEQMQYLFDSKSGNVDYLENREAVTNNRLSSAYNQIQNATGFFRTFTTAFTQAIKTGSPKQIAKVFGKEFVNSWADAKSILIKGRVSRGSAFSDLTRVTEGEPRVRFLEYGKGEFLGGRFLGKPIYAKLGGKTVDLNPLNQAYKRIKYIQRLLETVDTFSSSVVSGLTQYGQIKSQVDRFYPELSGKEKSKIVWDMMYSLDRTKEIESATKGLQKAGVETPTKYEINRAINEKVERERNKKISDEFYKNVESLKPMARTKLKGEGNANPTAEQIQEEAYKMLGYDEPLDVVARGERQAGRETGKTSTFGITSAILLPIDGLQAIIRKIGSSKTNTATNVSNTLDFTMSQLFPFVHSIARWTEMQLELTPYGLLKGAIYKTGLPKQFEGKAKIPMQEYKELGDDFMIRSILGAGYTTLGMFGISFLKNLAGDEDEAEEAIKGTKQDEKFTQERVKGVVQPKQSVRIGGYNLPLQILGNEGIVMGMYADFNSMMKDPEMEEKGITYISVLVAMNAILDATWANNASKYGGIATSIFKGKEEKYEPALGRIVGSFIGSQVPYNRLQTEVATVLNPQTKQSVDFGVNVLNQMSITRAFGAGKPSFDYRGRTYEYGDIYVNSADGIVKMFRKSKYGDDADKFLSEINFAATDAYRETKDAETYKYAITEKDGTKRFMTNDEYYDFKLKAAKTFDELIKNKYQSILKQSVKIGGKVDNAETMKVRKEMASFLLDYSKKTAFLDIQKKSGFTPYESEKDIEIKGEIKGQKKEMYELLGLDEMKESIKENFLDN